MMHTFIALPISSVSRDELAEIDLAIDDAVDLRRSDLQISYAGRRYLEGGDELNPYEEVQWDFDQIKACNHFIMIYPKSVASSCLIELGYALALRKRISLIYKNDQDLPFMLKNLPENFRMMKYKYFDLGNTLKLVLLSLSMRAVK